MIAYVTTFCNFPHRLRDGRPIGHECYVIPPAALRAEVAGNIALACDLIQTGKTVRQYGEWSLPVSRGVRG